MCFLWIVYLSGLFITITMIINSIYLQKLHFLVPVSEHWVPKSYSSINTVCELVTKSEGKKNYRSRHVISESNEA